MTGSASWVNLGLLALEQVLLGGGVLLLHRWRHRYGLAPFIIFLAGLVTILHALGSTGLFVPVGSTAVEVSSVTLVPVLVMAVLVLYVVDGTAPTRVTILGVVGLSSLILLIQLGRLLHLEAGATPFPALGTDGTLIGRSWRVTVSSTVSLVFSLAAVAVVYQTLRNRVPSLPRWSAIGLALLGALVADDALFRLTVEGWSNLAASWPVGLAGKVMAAFVLWPMAWAHVRASEREGHSSSNESHRPSLDLLFGSYQERDRALRRSEERLGAIASQAPLVLFSVDRDGIFTASQGAGLRSLGLEPGEVVGDSAFTMFPEAESNIRTALEGQTVTRIVRVREDQLAFDVTYSPIREGEEVTGVSGVAVDITERLAAEQALKDSELRFRSTFEQAAVGLVHADPEGNVTLANRALRTMLDLPEEGSSFTSLVDLLHADDREGLRTGMRDLLHGAVDPYTADVRLLRTGGGWVWAHATISLVRTDAGTPLFFIAVLEDLTQRRATEEQLRHAQKIEAIGQLTGGVAHDFNNLLTVVIGGLDLTLHDDLERNEMREILEEVRQAARKGAALTQRLLAFSRRQTLQPVSLDVAGLLASMEKLLARTLGEAVEIQLGIQPQVASCVADRAQMESAILNLALNARDAMNGRGRLRIRADRVTPDPATLPVDVAPGPYLRVSVEDEGQGIPPEHLNRVFEPFFTTKRVGKGSGLGLSMVYGFAQQSNGFVRIDSEVGKGTTVELYLPVGEQSPAPHLSPTDGEPRGAGEHVVLVEDQADVRAMLVRMLSDLGYEVTPVDRARPALSLLADGAPVDILLTDVVLPDGASGADLAVRAWEIRPDLPVVFATGYTGSTGPLPTPEGQPAHLIHKPFRKVELARALRRALDDMHPS
ncbi:MAG: PAS domain S-box protein [Gemmatimonadota bacterium]|jgi:PAS domain S-box-containing protein